MKTFDVVGLGAHNIDLLKKNADVVMAPGGAAGNTIVGLSKLGLRCGIQGTVGIDGQMIIDSFQQHNVEYSHLIQDNSEQVGYGYVKINKEGQSSISYNSGANSLLRKSDINLAYLKDSKWVHFSTFVDEKQYSIISSIIRQLDKTVKNSFWVDENVLQFGLKKFEKILPFIHTIFIKDSVLVSLTGMGSIDGAKTLLVNGSRTVAVIYSPHDSSILSSNDTFHLHSKETKVIDSTGASCAFASGYIYGQLQGKDIKSSGLLGNVAMSLNVVKIGSRANLPTKQKLIKKLSHST